MPPPRPQHMPRRAHYARRARLQTSQRQEEARRDDRRSRRPAAPHTQARCSGNRRAIAPPATGAADRDLSLASDSGPREVRLVAAPGLMARAQEPSIEIVARIFRDRAVLRETRSGAHSLQPPCRRASPRDAGARGRRGGTSAQPRRRQGDGAAPACMADHSTRAREPTFPRR